MKEKNGRRGTILVATFLVISVIIIVASSMFYVIIAEKKSIERQQSGMQALSQAEAGIAAAFFESENLGWRWYTHKWNDAKDTLVPLDIGDDAYQQKLLASCSFDAEGFFVSNNGDFMVKAYPHQTRKDETIIVAKGINGTEQKAIKYVLSRKGIYDFFYYSPYSIDLNNEVGTYPRLRGGGIHTNGNIMLDGPVRLENISEFSTGPDGVIYYANHRQYVAPNKVDAFDGKTDGKAPIVRLDDRKDVFRDDAADNPGEFGYYYWDKYGTRHWTWKSYATDFANTSYASPREAFLQTEWYFHGNVHTWNNIASGSKDTYISSSIINDNDEPLNKYNVWIKPCEGVDDDGGLISRPWEQIPGQLDEPWEWSKYKATVKGEQPVSFYTYDDLGNKVNVENTYWEIAAGGVNWVDPAQLAEHPAAKTYWDMYQDPNYWKAIGESSIWADGEYSNPEVFDGTYGDERLGSSTIPVNHTHSKNQPNAWKDFLGDTDLAGIVCDGNTGGEYLAPPDFDTAYVRLADRAGLYVDLVDFDGKYDDFDEWQDVLEKSIDKAVSDINADILVPVAKKVKFINTFTGKWNVVLELDLAEMQKAGKCPNNGIVYSKVPIRLSNAETLPRKAADNGFTVLGEENIYLKGDYNTSDWGTAAVISKKRVFTLSKDFNDPQIKPATGHYRDYPYMYVKKDPVTNLYNESDPTKGGGSWVYRDYLNSSAKDYYPAIDDANEQALKDIINKKDSVYRALFDKHDPTGTASDTFTWPASGESYTYGMMPNRVYQNQTYNTLIASYRGTKGNTLEKWSSWDPIKKQTIRRSKYLNGAYFILDKNGGFTSAAYDFVDYESNGSNTSLDYDRRDALKWANGYATQDPYWALGYDTRFLTATRSPSDVFFGGSESLWIEVDVGYFYQMNF